jgi:hypothetical protein
MQITSKKRADYRRITFFNSRLAFLSHQGKDSPMITQQVDIIARSDHNWQSIEEDDSNRPPAKSKRRPARSAARIPRSSDRLIGFAKAVRKQINGATFTCEEFHPQSGPQSILYVVLERGADQWRNKIIALHNDYFSAELADPSAPVQIEVIDRATHEALQRLVDTGLIARTASFGRSLWPTNDSTHCPPPLSEAEREKAGQYRHQAARKLKAARVLADGDLDEEARQALMDAIEPLGRALAVENRWPEPQSLEDALLPPFGGAWKEALPVVRNFLREPSQSVTRIVSALTHV